MAGLSACGPAPEPVAPSQPEQPKAAAVQPKPVASAFDLSPVAEPEIIGIARWKNPSATLSSLSSCTGLPPQLIEGNSKKLADLILRDVLGGAIDTAELASVVALDAPIDMVVALDTSGKKRAPSFAISVGLTSLERAKGAVEGRERGAPLVEMAPGMWKVGDKDTTDASCAIIASVGGAPARLVCGEKDRDVMALGPYLARNAPTANFAGGDMHGELRFLPVSARYGAEMKQQLKALPILAESQLSIGEPTFDKAVSTAAAGLQDELTALVGDLDKVSLDIAVDPGSCVNASGALQLRGNTSWLAGTVSDRVDRAGPPPAIFWQLPKDSDAAFFGRGTDPTRYTAVLQTLQSLAEGALAKYRFGTPADRKALMNLLGMRLSKDTNVVQATGHIDAPAPGSKKDQGEPQIFDSLLNSWIGWSLAGVDEGPEVMTKSLKDFVAVYNRQAALAVAFDKANKKEENEQRELLKRGKELTIQDVEAREKKLPPRSIFTPLVNELRFDAAKLPTMKVVAAPAALGTGSMAVEIKLAGLPKAGGDAPRLDEKKPAKKETVTVVIHILLMADGKTTWIGTGVNKDELVKRLLMVKAGAPDTDKLVSRPSLEKLKNGKLMSGGFVTLVPFTKLAGTALGVFAPIMGGGSVPPEVQEAMRILTTLPHRGEAPVFFTTEATGGGAPRASMSFTMSQAVMEDIGAIIMGGLRVAAKMNP